MSYITMNINESKEIFEKIKQENLRTKVHHVDKNGKPSPEEIREAVKGICLTLGKLFIGRFITLFVNHKLSEFAVKRMEKSRENKKLFEFIEKEIDKVYKKHPDYKKCSLKEFEKTSMFDYFCSEWRDKTPKEFAKNVGWKVVDSTITVAVSDLIPIPGSTVLAIPVKMILVYAGCKIGIASITNIAVEVNGCTLAVGINYRPVGFTLSHLILYSFKGDKLIGSQLNDPPEDLYKITQEDADKILEKYKDVETIDDLRKEVQKINERNR